MIARNATSSRSRLLRNRFADPFHGWSMKIIGPKPKLEFVLHHTDWSRWVKVSAATLRNRKRFEAQIVEQALRWPDETQLDRLYGTQAQDLSWVPGVIGALMDQARQDFDREAGK